VLRINPELISQDVLKDLTHKTTIEQTTFTCGIEMRATKKSLVNLGQTI